MPTPPLLNRLAATGAALLVAGAVVACDPAPTPPPASPSATSPASTDPTSPNQDPTTPSPTPSPTLSKQEQDYQDAAHAVREANRIIDETLMEPDKHKAYPAELKKYVDPDGPYWALQAQGLSDYRKEGKRFSAVGTVKQLTPVGTYNPNQLTLYRCNDSSGGKVLDKDGKTLSEGGLVESRLVLHKEDDRWRVWGYEHLDGDGRVSRAVDKCEEDPK